LHCTRLLAAAFVDGCPQFNRTSLQASSLGKKRLACQSRKIAVELDTRRTGRIDFPGESYQRLTFRRNLHLIDRRLQSSFPKRSRTGSLQGKIASRWI